MGAFKESQELVAPDGATNFLALHELGKKLRYCIRRTYLAKPIDWILDWHRGLHNNVSMDLFGISDSKNRSLPITWDRNTCNTIILEMIKGSEQNRKQRDIELARLVEEFAEKLEHDPYQPGIVHPEIYPDDLQEVIEDIFFIRGFSEATIKVVKNPDGMSIQVQVLNRGGINNKNSEDTDETA